MATFGSARIDGGDLESEKHGFRGSRACAHRAAAASARQ
jgi:hypothetical protein